MPKLQLLRTCAVAFSAMVVAMPGQAMQLIPVHGETAGHACRTKGSSRFIGKLGTTMTGAAVRDVSGAAILRWAPPGTMLTMDYRADRVTVYLDGRKKITRITCG